MADYEATGEALQKLVRLGKKQSMPFAFCPSKGDDESLFATHRKRAPDIIAKAARKASGQTKVCFGTFTVSGKLMTLTLIQELPAIAKKLKKHLRRERLSLNIKILDASGNELEADIEDLGDEPDTDDSDFDDDFDDDDDSDDYDASQSEDEPSERVVATDDASLSEEDTPDDAETDPADASALLARIAALEPKLSDLPEPARGKLQQALASVTALIDAGSLPRAAASLDAVEQAFARVAPTPAPPAPAPPADDPALQLAQRLTQMQADLQAIGEPALGKLSGALATIAGQIKAGDLNLASATMDKIAPALNTFKAAAARKAAEAQPTPEADTEAKAEAPPLTPEEQAAEDDKMAGRWESVSAKLEPVVLSTINAGLGDIEAIRAKFAAMQALAANGQAKEALAQSGDLSRMLREAQAQNAGQSAPEYPADALPFLKSRSAWLKTRDQLRAEIGRLQAAMNAALAGVEGMELAISETGKLFDYIESLDIRLIGALDSLVVEPDGPGREKLKDSARSIIADYSAELDSPFFVDVDANNGFASVKVRGPAITVLKQVSAALT